MPTPLLRSNRNTLLVWLVCLLLFIGGVFILPNFMEWNSNPSYRFQAQTVAVQFSAAIKQFHTEYGFSPGGDSAHVLTTLRGNNPSKIIFFEASSNWINPKGELIDPWGTPYRFDLSDPKNPRVWSCGKNRRDDGGTEGSDDIPSWR